MKTKIFQLLAIMAISLGFAACHDDNWEPQTDKEGKLCLSSIGVDVQVDEAVVSRASSVDVSNFTVEILQSGAVVEKWLYNKLPEIITLPVGDYTCRVYSHKVEPVAWEAPYYMGSKSFSIENGKITDIGTVVCKFASVRVSIKYSDALAAYKESDWKVTVVAGTEGTTATFGVDETRSAYFEAVDESMTLTATFEGTVRGNAERKQAVYTDVKAGNHYIINFDVKGGGIDIPEEVGSIDPVGSGSAITINREVIGESVDVNASVEEDPEINPTRPGTEDPADPSQPGDPTPPATETITFSCSTLSFDQPNNVATASSGVVLIHSDNPMAHLNVKIDSNNANFIASAGELLPLDFDLCYPGEDAEAFASLGFPVGSEIIGANDVTFDISQFIPLLAAFPGTHTFTIGVDDNAGSSRSVSLTFIAQ